MTEPLSHRPGPMDEESAWMHSLIESCEPPDDGFSLRVLQSLPSEPQASTLGAVKGHAGIWGLRLHDLLDPNIWQLYVWTSLATMAVWWLSSGISSWVSAAILQDSANGVIK